MGAKILLCLGPPRALEPAQRSKVILFFFRCEVIYNTEKPYPTREGLLKDIKGVDALFFIAHTIKLDKEMLDAAGK